MVRCGPSSCLHTRLRGWVSFSGCSYVAAHPRRVATGGEGICYLIGFDIDKTRMQGSEVRQLRQLLGLYLSATYLHPYVCLVPAPCVPQSPVSIAQVFLTNKVEAFKAELYEGAGRAGTPESERSQDANSRRRLPCEALWVRDPWSAAAKVLGFCAVHLDSHFDCCPSGV